MQEMEYRQLKPVAFQWNEARRYIFLFLIGPEKSVSELWLIESLSFLASYVVLVNLTFLFGF